MSHCEDPSEHVEVHVDTPEPGYAISVAKPSAPNDVVGVTEEVLEEDLKITLSELVVDILEPEPEAYTSVPEDVSEVVKPKYANEVIGVTSTPLEEEFPGMVEPEAPDPVIQCLLRDKNLLYACPMKSSGTCSLKIQPSCMRISTID